jgi:hypothetical protein
MTLLAIPNTDEALCSRLATFFGRFFCGLFFCWFAMGCFSTSSAESFGFDENFCEGACNPLPVIVQDTDTAEVITDTMIRVTQWRDTHWEPVLECGAAEQDAQNSAPAQVAAPGCFLSGQTGFYQFTVFAPGYDTLERRIRFNSAESSEDPFLCDCTENNVVELELHPLMLDE